MSSPPESPSEPPPSPPDTPSEPPESPSEPPPSPPDTPSEPPPSPPDTPSEPPESPSEPPPSPPDTPSEPPPSPPATQSGVPPENRNESTTPPVSSVNPVKGITSSKGTSVGLIAGCALGGILLVLVAVGIFIWFVRYRRKRKKSKQRGAVEIYYGDFSGENKGATIYKKPRFGSLELEQKNRQFTYSELVKFTNNFERTLGKGGFGTVYHGYIEKTQVAVKMLSPSSVQGFQEFQAEVSLLMRVHHTNLTSLVGYCNDESSMGLVYEYMANGNLQEHLSDSSSNILGWEDRLRIAADAAQGLEYLHYGCKPPIVHRDVKSANILLTENFQAKVSDFGLSRNFPTDGGTHISTVVAGTPGYLDPELLKERILLDMLCYRK